MNDTLTYQPEPFERPEHPPKKGCGCGSIFIGFLLFIFAIIAAIWLIIMHTSVPLRFVADLIEDGSKSSNLKITGVSGSLSSGLNFKKVTWDGGEIADMRFHYSGIMDVIRRDQLIIHEMHIGSATIHYDSQADQTQETEIDPATTSSSSSTSSTGSSTEPPLRLLQIDLVSLNKIIIKDRTTGKTIDIPKIQWTGFKAEKGADIQFGDLVAKSDHLVIKTSNPPGFVYQKRFEITLLPKLHDSILKPILIDAHLGEKDKKTIYEIKAFDETVILTKDKSGDQEIKTKDSNLAEFFDAPLPNKLNFESTETESATQESIVTINGGSFLLGTKTFEIQPSSFTSSKDTPSNPSLIAIHRAGETEIRYEVLMNNESFTANLASTPAVSPENLLALIFHDREFAALSTPEQEKIRKDMTWFTFAK